MTGAGILRFAITAVPLLVVASHVTAQVNRVRAVSEELSTVEGMLEVLDEERLTIRIDDGTTVTNGPDRIAFIEFTGTLENSPPDGRVRNGLLRLVDGTRHTGWFDTDRDEFVWLNWWSGSLTPDIDTIVSFSRDGNDPIGGSDRSEDLVVLANGDRLPGLVLDVTDAVSVERVDGSMVRIPLERVDQVTLVNPLDESEGVRAWLTRGDEVRIGEFRFDSGTGLRTPGREPIMPNYIHAIAFDASRLVALAALPTRLSELEESPRYHVAPPDLGLGAWPLDAPPIGIMGPVRAEWTLPETGMGLVATVVLDERYREHGDLELVVLDAGEVVASHRLDARNPRQELTIPLRTRELAIEIREGDSGPVQDHVTLERALLLRPRKAS